MINAKETLVYDSYKNIYMKLQKTTNTFLKVNSIDEIKRFIYIQRKENEDGFKNSLIELPNDDIKSVIKSTYTKIDYLEGTLGTVDATDQFDGITNMALLMLMSNRMSKYYKNRIKSEQLSPEEKDLYHKNEVALLRWKSIAMKDLIASLYILNKTEIEYTDFISYGYRQDNNKKDSFVIDLPYYGQICVHFGKQMQYILMDAKKTVSSILNKKLQLGQISQEDVDKLKQNLDEEILPNYTGKLYEYSSAIPIEYEGDKSKTIKEHLGLNRKLPEDINKSDILNLYNIGLNAREIYYFAIKFGLPKKQLNYIVNIGNKFLDAKNIGKSALSETTAKERQVVNIHENNVNINEIENDKRGEK